MYVKGGLIIYVQRYCILFYVQHSSAILFLIPHFGKSQHVLFFHEVPYRYETPLFLIWATMTCIQISTRLRSMLR